MVQVLSAPRSAGVSVNRRPPWRRSVAASDPGCGCERRARRAQALFTARHRLFGQDLEASADHRISEAQPRRGGRRERARVGELGIWKPGILPRVADSQAPRIPAFQLFAPAGGLGGRDRGAGERGGGRRPGELETWNAGNPRGAAWGGSTRARWCSGVAASGALGRRPWPPPWPGGARPSRREGSAFGTQERGVSGMHDDELARDCMLISEWVLEIWRPGDLRGAVYPDPSDFGNRVGRAGHDAVVGRRGGDLANWKPENLASLRGCQGGKSSPSRSQREYRPVRSYSRRSAG